MMSGIKTLCRKRADFRYGMLFISSNTGMAVVPDLNRISFCIYSVNNFSNRIFYINIDFGMYCTKFSESCQDS